MTSSLPDSRCHALPTRISGDRDRELDVAQDALIDSATSEQLSFHFVPEKVPGESQTAYIWRFAETNGINPRQLARKLLQDRGGPHFRRTSLDNQLFSHIREVLVGDTGEAALKLDNPVTRRICPLCIEDCGTTLAAFQCYAYSYCLSHRCKILSECPSCQQVLAWFTGTIEACQCGQPLKSITPEIATNAGFELFTAVLENRELRYDYLTIENTARNPVELSKIEAVTQRLIDTQSQLTRLPDRKHSRLHSLDYYAPDDIQREKNSWCDLAEILHPWPSGFFRAAVNLHHLGYRNAGADWNPLSIAIVATSETKNESTAIYGDLQGRRSHRPVRSWHSPGIADERFSHAVRRSVAMDWKTYVRCGFVPRNCNHRPQAPAFFEHDAYLHFASSTRNGASRLGGLPGLLKLAMIESTAYGTIAPLVPIDMEAWRFDGDNILSVRNKLVELEDQLLKVSGLRVGTSINRYLKIFRAPMTLTVIDRLLQNVSMKYLILSRIEKLSSTTRATPESWDKMDNAMLKLATHTHNELLHQTKNITCRWRRDAATIAHAYLQWGNPNVAPENVGKTPKVRYTNHVLSPFPKTYP